MNPLISASELMPLIGATDLVLVDCRHDLSDTEAGRRAYAAGHLPGARFLHLDEHLSGAKTGRNGRHPLPDPVQLARHLGAAGIGTATQVVAYDAQGGMYAARLWWLLRWLGHAQVRVLDGGVPAWLAAGGSLETRVPVPTATQFVPKVLAGMAVDVDAVMSTLAQPAFVVIDARAPGRYAGEGETLDPVAGHIPGARNRFFQHNLSPEGTFKPAAQLRDEWSAVLAGIAPTDTVQQCGSGVTACHNLLALEVAGLSGARLYPGSWSEWCADTTRPVARGAEPL